MEINIKDVITLEDDKDYVVVSKITKNNKVFYYLIDKDNTDNLMICYENDNTLTEINDEDIIKELLPEFIEVALPEFDIDEN